MIAPGSLWTIWLERTAQALATGALAPIPTRSERVVEAGIPFLVRVVEDAARRKRMARGPRSAGPDPFRPEDPALRVGELSPSHLALLNKYPALEHHLLLVTRAPEDQESLVTLSDLEALWIVLREVDGLGFYNAGPVAGASQTHKHLQLVPLPLGPDRLPLAPALAAARLEGWLGTLPVLPFVHAVAHLGGCAELAPLAAAEATRGVYLALLRRTGIDPGDPRPYNLLVTREWMWLVPRTRAATGGIEVNALGFAGALLVRDDTGLRRVHERGPLAILRAVSASL